LPPKLFRQFFKPRYARVYQEAHRHGMLTFLHSCGHIADLLDDLIEAELDVIQMDQQENMGMENLARRFGGRLCFWCPVDIQQTMVFGGIEDVRSYARKLMYTLGNFNGGFIAQWYASPQAVNHSQEKINAMAETFVKYGRYPLAS
jgi:uroporphyrinogen-III decarboxylase